MASSQRLTLLEILFVSSGLICLGSVRIKCHKIQTEQGETETDANSIQVSSRADNIERRVAVLLLPLLLLLLNLVRFLLLPLELLLAPLILLITLLLRLLLRLLELLLILILRPELFLLMIGRLLELIVEALRLLADLLRIRIRVRRKEKHRDHETTVITIDEVHRKQHKHFKIHHKKHQNYHNQRRQHVALGKNKSPIREYDELKRRHETTEAILRKANEISQKLHQLELHYVLVAPSLPIDLYSSNFIARDVSHLRALLH